jgi:hypothetical protein
MKSRASSGHHSTNWVSPSQRSQTKATLLSGCNWIAQKLQASTHQAQPSHASSSTIMTPVFSDCNNASRGQSITHWGTQSLQAMVTLTKGFKRTTRILDFVGL